jgi:hypothetical protein
MAEFGSVKWYGKRIFTAATKETVKAMHQAGAMLTLDVKKHFTRQGGYRRYRRGESGYHWSSMPGAPPAVDTGSLRASVDYDVNVRRGEVIGRVGSDIDKLLNELRKRAPAAIANLTGPLDYGLYLEVGTKDMAARPWLVPALRRMKLKIERVFQRRSGKFE